MMHDTPCARRARASRGVSRRRADDRRAHRDPEHLGECGALQRGRRRAGRARRDAARPGRGRRRASSRSKRCALSAHVIERLRVEEPFSIRAQVADWFQDMHLVWAGLGASVATVICVVGSASVLHAANQERPNSMARVDRGARQPRLERQPAAAQLRNDRAARRHRRRDRDVRRGRRVRAVGGGVARRPRAGRRDDQSSRADRPGVNAMLNEAYRVQFAPAHGARRRGGGEHGVAGGEHDGEGPPRRDDAGAAAGAAADARRPRRSRRCRFRPKRSASRSRRRRR